MPNLYSPHCSTCLFTNVTMLSFISSLFWFQLGKSVVAKVAIRSGVVLSLDMFAVKVGEPKGIPPENIQQLVGKKLKVDEAHYLLPVIIFLFFAGYYLVKPHI
uniref:AFP-like domain-containing protein n=1 Tax=Echeneis naucrates TaxID=173247 RepID=A0A665TDU7_ECHNA